MLTKLHLIDAKSELAPISNYVGSDDNKLLDKQIPYREAIGSLIHAANCTRPDIAYAVEKASSSSSEWLLHLDLNIFPLRLS